MVDNSGIFVSILSVLGGQSPVLLVLIGGMIYAGIKGREHPKASMWLGIGLAIIFLSRIIGTSVSIALPFYAENAGIDFTTIGWQMGGINILLNCVNAVAWIMILVATFGWRNSE